MDRSVVASWSSVTAKFMALNVDKVQVMYVWVDGTRQWLRAKTRTFDKTPETPEDVPSWSYCGYGTYQADGAADSEMVLRCVALYPDPFRPGPHRIALCDVYVYNKVGALKPHNSNKRFECAKNLEMAFRQQCWFGFEQEYQLLDTDLHPLGWPKGGYPAPMGPYYCSVGTGRALARDIVEAHYRAMMYAGVAVHGTNAEANPGQWEWQLRPLSGLEAGDQMWLSRFLLHRICEEYNVSLSHYRAMMYAGVAVHGTNAEANPGQWEWQLRPLSELEAGDQMWLSRFLLHRICEEYNVVASLDPKPIPIGNWSGSGVHVNFSTKAMREEGGIDVIETAVEKLSRNHAAHIAVYDPKGGLDNRRRLTGLNETGHIDIFTSGIGDRTVSIRIPREVAYAKKGYLEDRRPSSNVDPYEAIGALTKTICLSD